MAVKITSGTTTATPQAGDLTIILDRSGSMGHIQDETIDGFNQLIEDQKAFGGDVKVTLVLFNDTVERPAYAQTPIADVDLLNRGSYIPRGLTALLDAVGETCVALRSRIAANPQGVLVVIITDGHENASKEWGSKKDELKKMVEGMEAEGVTFLFLGANIDAFGGGASMGVAAQNSANFAHTGRGVSGAYSYASTRMKGLRSTGGTYEGMEQEMHLSMADATEDGFIQNAHLVDPLDLDADKAAAADKQALKYANEPASEECLSFTPVAKGMTTGEDGMRGYRMAVDWGSPDGDSTGNTVFVPNTPGAAALVQAAAEHGIDVSVVTGESLDEDTRAKIENRAKELMGGVGDIIDAIELKD